MDLAFSGDRLTSRIIPGALSITAGALLVPGLLSMYLGISEWGGALPGSRIVHSALRLCGGKQGGGGTCSVIPLLGV